MVVVSTISSIFNYKIPEKTKELIANLSGTDKENRRWVAQEKGHGQMRKLELDQVQVHLSLLPSGSTSTPRQFRRFCPTQSGYVNIHPNTNLYLLYKNNPDQNIIHVLVEKLPGSESNII
ncbi:hypothetical protein F8M41_001089 [Gigaspora margarita]|uniref:Uncharacterized protein n=1 Tax=Gigaspora margarita TaxID=4874 RepID=A0A8H4AAB8_GIGMA|nr:hypothetical protein F8M41_001089 [Gigaspora margarita]